MTQTRYSDAFHDRTMLLETGIRLNVTKRIGMRPIGPMDGVLEALGACSLLSTALFPSIPFWHMSTDPQPLSLAQVFIVNISVRERATRLRKCSEERCISSRQNIAGAKPVDFSPRPKCSYRNV